MSRIKIETARGRTVKRRPPPLCFAHPGADVPTRVIDPVDAKVTVESQALDDVVDVFDDL